MSLRGITKRFGELTAVDSIDLDIKEGEFFTLLGPSGCGKTTTLRMIAGFEEPNEGQILVDGNDVAGLPAHKRPTNTVFQSYALFPHLTVRENVAYGLKRKRVDKSEMTERVDAELERVGLANEANRKPNQLSGGQQQRVALARAVVNLPKVLLLDEPLGPSRVKNSPSLMSRSIESTAVNSPNRLVIPRRLTPDRASPSDVDAASVAPPPFRNLLSPGNLT